MHTDEAIRTRKTEKILGDPENLPAIDEQQQTQVRNDLEELLQLAGNAPFHKPADAVHLKGADAAKAGLDALMPWRFYLLDQTGCQAMVRLLALKAKSSNDSMWQDAWQSKIPRLLAGAHATVLACWLPDPPGDPSHPETVWTLNNQEHLAAASAAVQNLLLGATARQYHNYWSSGGIFREPALLQQLGIPVDQILLGAIFLTHSSRIPAVSEIKVGGLRAKRTPPEHWSRWVSVETALAGPLQS